MILIGADYEKLDSPWPPDCGFNRHQACQAWNTSDEMANQSNGIKKEKIDIIWDECIDESEEWNERQKSEELKYLCNDPIPASWDIDSANEQMCIQIVI